MRSVRKSIFRCGVWFPARLHDLVLLPSSSCTVADTRPRECETILSRDIVDIIDNQPFIVSESTLPVILNKLNHGLVVSDRETVQNGLINTNPGSAEVAPGDDRRRPSTDALLFGLLNAQSTGNKYAAICNSISERAIQICLLTETWHDTNRDTALKRCVPPGYSLHDVPRPLTGATQNHGGLQRSSNQNQHFGN